MKNDEMALELSMQENDFLDYNQDDMPSKEEYNTMLLEKIKEKAKEVYRQEKKLELMKNELENYKHDFRLKDVDLFTFLEVEKQEAYKEADMQLKEALINTDFDSMF